MTDSNVLNIPCSRCSTGWMVIQPDPRTLEPRELRCSNCTATQPLPASMVMRSQGAAPLPGFDS